MISNAKSPDIPQSTLTIALLCPPPPSLRPPWTRMGTEIIKDSFFFTTVLSRQSIALISALLSPKAFQRDGYN